MRKYFQNLKNNILDLPKSIQGDRISCLPYKDVIRLIHFPQIHTTINI